ncbi:MAG: outer membrane protein assembly factor BamB, partial [Betaproteobacteria bacterium]|nr:outer membrane protein assembly factor BamB [Betaproteobacteria bacterium]
MARAAALAVAAALLAGCFGGAAGGPKPAPLEPLAQAAEPRRLWRASIGGADEFQFSPARVGDAVYAASRAGEVVQLDSADGRERWAVSLDARLSGGVGADERTVAVGTDRAEVLALEARDGKLRWRARVSSEVLAAPRPAGELILVRSADSRVHALGASDGKRRWVYQRTPAPLTLRAPRGLAVLGDLVFAGFSGGKLVALSVDSGAVRWEATVALPKGATELERVTDVIGDPAVIGKEVCAAAFQGRVACFDAASGTQLWARELSSVTGVSVDARYAYVSDEHGAVHALDRSNGRSLWKQDRLAHRQLSLPLPVGGAIVVGDFEGYLHFLARDSGAFLARAPTDGSAVRSAPLALD